VRNINAFGCVLIKLKRSTMLWF